MRKNSASMKFLGFLVILAIICAGAFAVLSSQAFEKNSPKVEINDTIYWNLKTPMSIKFTDDVGIKFVRISMSDGQNEINMLNQVLQTPMSAFDVNLTFPKTGFFSNKKDSYDMNIEAVDTSKWNFFGGNKTQKKVKVILDTTRPELYILSQSYSISRGGAAVVIFKANDSSLSDVFVQTNYGKRFEVTPFYKDGYYASLVVWPVKESNFVADIVARDSAGNESKAHVRYFLENVKYRSSTIALKDNFLDGKIETLANKYAKDMELDRLAKMKFVNETLRDLNDNKIIEMTTKTTKEMMSDFNINTFYPLRNGKKVADFADHRFYTYNGQQVSESWHMGIDFASVAQAPILSSNPGRVVFAEDNGIYGLNVLIDHGFGLYSLYGHCTNLNVDLGSEVRAGTQIGTTGTTGLALGDHLHFGILIQGEEVRPQQWMDKKWIKDNITSVMSAAKAMIDKN
ncbi:M23 family metallopeptidase [Campylobacter mucosalis]|uniref:M23 family metallopeptidase n=1 Tax=Campylobacter mucosalis TaxID=202 RepID=UPI0020169068|nr:M23 family metallopeptidase [Campylobacter mucosalis]